MPIRRRRTTGSIWSPEISSPSNRTSPSARELVIRSFIRLKQRNSVLLPQPEGPINAVILLRGISIVMFLRARLGAVPDREAARSRARSDRGRGPAGSGGAGAAAGGFGVTRSVRVSETLIDGLAIRKRPRSSRLVNDNA